MKPYRSAKPDTRAKYMPTQLDIVKACLVIRRGWSIRERRKRMGMNAPVRVEIEPNRSYPSNG